MTRVLNSSTIKKSLKTMRKRYIPIISVLFALVSLTALIAAGQFPEWVAPAEEASVQNPVTSSPKVISNGRIFYDLQCKSCHGVKGLGDGIIPSANLVSDEFQAQSDGSIFWKLQQGRTQMPSFAAMPAEQLWEVIHYLRDLAKPVEVLVKKRTLILLHPVEQDSVRKVIAKAFELTASGERTPLADKRLILGVKRIFGVMPLATTSTYTNAEGRITGTFPDDLPADTAGNVVIVAYVDDPAYEPGTVEETLPWGQPWIYTDITKQRSLWAHMRYAPYWLLISFTAVAGAIWLTILFVMMELKKINDKGRKHAKAMAQANVQ
jgi:mono/diheme cytochrome c family protein